MQCLSEENAVVLAYWREKAGSRAMPARSDLDPVLDLRELSKYLFLVDVGKEGEFRFRVMGSGLVGYLGVDVTGLSLDELVKDGQPFAAYQEQFAEIVGTRAPRRGVFQLPSQYTQHETQFEHLILPLSNDGRTVNMLLGTFNPPSEETPEDKAEVFVLTGTRSGSRGDDTTAEPRERQATTRC